METIALDIAKFRLEFAEFSDPSLYSDLYISAKWDAATCYMSDLNEGRLKDSCRQYGLFLMLAHLILLDDKIKSGVSTAVITSGSEGSVSVSFATPPSSGSWDWWMGLSIYGQQLNALLAAKSAGSFYVGGSPVRNGFRGVGGVI